MEEKRFTLRMDGILFEEISKLAKENHRSIAKEIEYAVGIYIYNLKKNKIINSLDFDNLTQDEAFEILKKFADIESKHDV